MKKIILKSAGALCLAMAVSAAPASAADMYSRGLKDGPAPDSWTGFYLGVHGGAAWGDINFQDSKYGNGTGVWNSGRVDATGAIYGAQLGYNIQNGALVYGLEVDLGGLDLSGSTAVYPHKFSTSGGFYGDITGRLGFTSGATLFYAKGGAAFLNETFKGSYYGGADNFSNSETLWGWTAGGGVEHKLNAAWSLKAEYLHFDFGEKTFKTFYPGYTLTYAPTADTIKLGVNYHVNSGYEPLK
jgi:opacity protein-like surface antigen